MNIKLPVGVYIEEELKARNWSTLDLAIRMGGNIAQNKLIVELLIAVHDKNLVLDYQTAHGLANAFDVNPEFFINLDKAYIESCGVYKPYL